MAHPLAHPDSNVEVNPWLIAVTVSMATFMEVMDTSIANVSLRHIAGDLAAGQSESTWVLTSYLVSNAIILPISGWLASVMGRKRFYLTCVALFTISSLCCGLAPNLGMLLFFRVLQGIGGGGLAPSEQSILADTFPEKLRGQAFALYAMAVVFAPAVGPTLGGWITDNYSWRWIFFINIPVGIVSLFLSARLVRDSKSAIEEHEQVWRKGLHIDYAGFALVALGLGCLQVVLDKGQEDDWFGSNFITAMAILSVIGIAGCIIWEFITPQPIVDLPLYKNRAFLATNLVMFGLFGGLLTTTQLIPQYVQQLMGYDATKAGLLLMPGGFLLIAMLPIIGRLVNIVQPKYLIAIGVVLEAATMEYFTNLDPQFSFRTLAIARAFQAGAIGFLFVPINTIAYIDLPHGKSNNASALINVMRNLGGSIGISAANTMLDRRSQFHQQRLVENVTGTSGAYRRALKEAMTNLIHQGATPAGAMRRALGLIYQNVQQQAQALSYIDVFKVLAIGSLLMLGLVYFLKRMKPGEAGAHAA